MKKNLKTWLSLLLVAAMLLSTLTACGSSSSDTEESTTTEETEETTEEAEESSAENSAETADDGSSDLNLADDQTLNILLSGTVNTLDPNASGWTGEEQIYTQTQAGLFRITSDGEGGDTYELDGAESYEISEDGLTYTFYLRENYWSDGEPVIAQHYVDSFLRNLDPDNGFSTTQYLDVLNAEAYYNGEVDASEVGVVALDDYTVQYTLEAPNSQFLYYLAYRSGFPARLDVIEAATSEYGTDPDEMVFCGPFVVTSWVKENSVTLEKNEYYWDADNVYLTTVNMQYVAEASTQATLFDAGQLDIVSYNDDYGEDWEEAAANGEINYIDQVGAYTYFLAFAIENGGNSGLMGNAKIRLALSLAIDREELVDVVWGRYEAAYTWVPPVSTVGTTTYNVSGEGLVKEQQEEYSTDEALQALFQEGLEELGEDTDLSAVSIDFVVEASTVANQTQAEYIAQTWENRLGITVNVDVTTDAEERQNALDYDVGINGWEGGSEPYDYLYVVNVPYGLKYLTGVYTNEYVNELLETVTSIADEAEKAEVYHEIEDTILEEAGVGPLYFGDIKYFAQTWVEGVSYTTFGPAYDFSHAYITAH